MSIRRRLGWAALALAAAGGILVTVAAALGFGFAPDDDPRDTPPPATAPVTKQDLIATEDESGRVVHAGEATLHGSGGTVTWLPTEGTTVKRGGTLIRVDNDPVVLLYGQLPAYRTLSPGTSGPDVRQFEENLARLGHTGFTVDEDFTWATSAAVEDWQSDLDMETTGRVESADIHCAAGPIIVTSLSVAVGDRAEGELLKAASRDRVVTVDLDHADERFAVTGTAVEVRLPDGSRVPATITGVASQTVPDDESEDETVIRVTVTPDDPKALRSGGITSATVSFTAERREGVLTVPVTALLALPEGGYAVEVSSGSETGSRTHLVPVDLGLFAAGRVEISGEDIAEGDRVVVPG